MLGGVAEGCRKESVTSSISNFCLAFTLLKDNRAERSSSSSILLSDFLLLGPQLKLVFIIWIMSKLCCQVIGPGLASGPHHCLNSVVQQKYDI